MKKDLSFRLWGRVFILPPWVKWLLILLAVLAVTGAGILIRNNRRSQSGTVILTSPTPAATPAAPTPSPPQTIWVYVVGEVNAPGVYCLSAGAMVAEAIEAAGGFTEQSDREAVNLVSVLRENTMIRVPPQGESESGGTWLISEGSSGQTSGSSGKININTAGPDALCTLSGIGESTAKKIISYREANGPFETIEDIMKVPGIKESKFEAIKENICVE